MKKLISITFILFFMLSMIPTNIQATAGSVDSIDSKKCRGNTIDDYEETGNKCRIFDDLSRPLCNSSCK